MQFKAMAGIPLEEWDSSPASIFAQVVGTAVTRLFFKRPAVTPCVIVFIKGNGKLRVLNYIVCRYSKLPLSYKLTFKNWIQFGGTGEWLRL